MSTRSGKLFAGLQCSVIITTLTRMKRVEILSESETSITSTQSWLRWPKKVSLSTTGWKYTSTCFKSESTVSWGTGMVIRTITCSTARTLRLRGHLPSLSRNMWKLLRNLFLPKENQPETTTFRGCRRSKKDRNGLSKGLRLIVNLLLSCLLDMIYSSRLKRLL